MAVKKQKLTPWFPPNVKPTRKGVYIATIDKSETFYRWWTGSDWLTGGDTVKQALREASLGLVNERAMHWRGLAEQPK